MEASVVRCNAIISRSLKIKLLMDQEDKKSKFTRLVLVHFVALERYAVSLCRNSFDADDLVSETLLKSFENFNRVRDEGKIKQWLFRILKNVFINFCRKQKNTLLIESVLENQTNPDPGDFSLFESIAKSNFVENGNPEKKFISILTSDQIEKAIQELPIDFREALILCDVEDFSYAEISGILKVPIGTVRSRIARARSILQKKLWLQAHELGIKSSATAKIKSDYTCTCGEEQLESANKINSLSE